jgi:putative integral membrane protein (TIGR02587 family)
MRDRCNRDYAKELARAAAGSVLFAFPLLMTMEMWWLGFYMEPLRLLIFLVVGLGLLFGLSYYGGFARAVRLQDEILDAFSALALGVVISAILLVVFGVVDHGTPTDEIIGKIAIQSIPAGMGAILARKQLGAAGEGEERERRTPTYGSELFLMFGGALFIAFNVAPTDEIALISHQMTPWHAIVLALISISLLHALVYSLEFSGQESWPDEKGFFSVFYHFSLVGYGISLLVGFYILWTFGRTDGTAFSEVVMMAVVLGFPASLGAATARLII